MERARGGGSCASNSEERTVREGMEILERIRKRGFEAAVSKGSQIWVKHSFSPVPSILLQRIDCFSASIPLTQRVPTIRFRLQRLLPIIREKRSSTRIYTCCSPPPPRGFSPRLKTDSGSFPSFNVLDALILETLLEGKGRGSVVAAVGANFAVVAKGEKRASQWHPLSAGGTLFPLAINCLAARLETRLELPSFLPSFSPFSQRRRGRPPIPPPSIFFPPAVSSSIYDRRCNLPFFD